MNFPWQVLIEGNMDENSDGNFILDDFSMTPECELSSNQHLPGEGEITTPSPICSPGLLPCHSMSQCYSPEEACNFINDCDDGTDELECSELSGVFMKCL